MRKIVVITILFQLVLITLHSVEDEELVADRGRSRDRPNLYERTRDERQERRYKRTQRYYRCDPNKGPPCVEMEATD